MQEITCKLDAKNSMDFKQKNRSNQQAVLENPDKMSLRKSSLAKRFISIRYKAALSKHRKSVHDKIMYSFRKGYLSNSRIVTSSGYHTLFTHFGLR